MAENDTAAVVASAPAPTQASATPDGGSGASANSGAPAPVNATPHVHAGLRERAATPTSPAAIKTDAPTAAQQEAAELKELNYIEALLNKRGLDKRGNALAAAADPSPDDAGPQAAADPDSVETADTLTADDSPAEAEPALALSEPDAQLLQRFQIDPEDLPADPARREKVLARYRQTQKFVSDLASENGRLKKAGDPASGKPPGSPDAQASGQVQLDQAALAKALAPATEMLGDDAAKGIQSAVEMIVAAHLSAMGDSLPLPQMDRTLGTLLKRLETADFDAGLERSTFPDGVKKSDAKVRTQIRREAIRLFQAEKQGRIEQGLDPIDLEAFNMGHAVERAVPLVFAKQFAAQAAALANERKRQQHRGIPDAGGRSPSAGAKLTADEKDRQQIEAILKKHNLPVT